MWNKSNPGKYEGDWRLEASPIPWRKIEQSNSNATIHIHRKENANAVVVYYIYLLRYSNTGIVSLIERDQIRKSNYRKYYGYYKITAEKQSKMFKLYIMNTNVFYEVNYIQR
jgi:hypothetical protein